MDKESLLEGIGDSETDSEEAQNPVRFFLIGEDSITADEFIRLPVRKLRNGMVGDACTATLPSGVEVMLKRLPATGEAGLEAFFEKVQQFGHFEHANLGRVVGCYSSRQNRTIIFKHCHGLNLHDLLRLRSLQWRKRLLIAKGVARGLHYLHQNLPGERAPHGNLKSSNVIVPLSGTGRYIQSCEPKLVNYGFIHLLPFGYIRHVAAGCTPEVMQKLLPETSIKTDIYCLGMLLLQLLTGINPKGRERRLVQTVREKMMQGGDEWRKGLDSLIVNEFENEGSMLQLLRIALECTAEEPQRRPEMSRLLEMMNAIN